MIVMRSGKGSTCKNLQKDILGKNLEKIANLPSNSKKTSWPDSHRLLRGITLCTTWSFPCNSNNAGAIFSSWRKIPMMDWQKGKVARKWLPLLDNTIIILTKSSASRQKSRPFIKGFFCISKSWRAHSFHEDPLQAWLGFFHSYFSGGCSDGDAVNGIQRATKESRIPLFWYLKYYEPRARGGSSA